MQVYLVGGAVRDYVLAREVTEHDYVVVGATPEQMLELGFSQVGADFPVFYIQRPMTNMHWLARNAKAVTAILVLRYTLTPLSP